MAARLFLAAAAARAELPPLAALVQLAARKRLELAGIRAAAVARPAAAAARMAALAARSG
jgi:hypothetical protein